MDSTGNGGRRYPPTYPPSPLYFSPRGRGKMGAAAALVGVKFSNLAKKDAGRDNSSGIGWGRGGRSGSLACEEDEEA